MIKGSIQLFLEGPEDRLRHLADLHQSGELQALLNGLKSDDIPEIVVTRAEFTTDAEVNEKTKLIKAIREGAVDKATLRFANLSGAILIDVDLRKANLNEAILRGANLSKADMSEADMNEADMSEAILNEADMSEAILRGAILNGADLRGVDLSGATVQNASFIGATGITPEQKQDLIQRGAIFADNSNVPN